MTQDKDELAEAIEAAIMQNYGEPYPPMAARLEESLRPLFARQQDRVRELEQENAALRQPLASMANTDFESLRGESGSVAWKNIAHRWKRWAQDGLKRARALATRTEAENG